MELPDVQVRDNPLVDGRMITYTSTVKPDMGISAATQKDNNSGVTN